MNLHVIPNTRRKLPDFDVFCLIKTLPTGNKSPTTLVHVLDDDSLLIVFSLCRPVILDESEANNVQLIEGGEWARERWWYRLIQVCHRWRSLVLQSAFYLQVSLVCGRGTPVADMLAQSPPVPLIIDHYDNEHLELTPEDEQGIVLALHHRDRVRRVRLLKPIPTLQKLILALDGEYPILEFLIIQHQRFHRPVVEPKTNLKFPDTFRAAHVCQVLLRNFATPIDSPPLATMVNLVTLFLSQIPLSAHIHPNSLLQRLYLMPQLEILWIGFNLSRDAERKLLRIPIMTRVTLPILRQLGYRGGNAYLEALLPWMTTPLLAKLQVYFSNRMVYTTPHLCEFMGAAKNLQLKAAKFTFFEDSLIVNAFAHKGDRLYTFAMELGGKHLDWQVVSAAQVFHLLRTVFSALEHLDLKFYQRDLSSEWNREADRTQWREFLGLFRNIKTIFVDDELVGQVSRALQPGEGESPAESEPFPELEELSYSATASTLNVFTPFIDSRQKAGRPVTIVHP